MAMKSRNCEPCEGKGYIIDEMQMSNSVIASARMCPKCKNISAYSKYVKDKYQQQPVEKPKVKVRLRLIK